MTPETPPPAILRPRPDRGPRYLRPAHVESVRDHVELGWQVKRTARDHFGPGDHALVLIRGEVADGRS